MGAAAEAGGRRSGRAPAPGRRLAAALAALLAAPSAQATWSIAAVDPATREVGVAGASCILGVEVIAALVPGTGAVVAQAWTHAAGRERLRELLAAGLSPPEALARVASRDFDSAWGLPTVELRQYGVAALGFEDAPASFTGSWTLGWAGGATGPGVSVQGNILRGPEVVSQALAAFAAQPTPCRATLADRLLAALEAGARAGGDARCSASLAALSALLLVAAPGDPPQQPGLRLLASRPGEPPLRWWVELRRLLLRPEPGGVDESPLRLLRRAYEAQRALAGGSPRCD